MNYEDGQLVPVVLPDSWQEPEDVGDHQRLRQEVIARLLASLTTGRDPLTIGRRVLVLAYMLSPDRSQKELAEELGVSGPAVCQALKRLRERLG